MAQYDIQFNTMNDTKMQSGCYYPLPKNAPILRTTVNKIKRRWGWSD